MNFDELIDCKVNLFKRFIDDQFILAYCTPSGLANLKSHLVQAFSKADLDLTIEESIHEMNFLDTTVFIDRTTKKPKIHTKEYRKSTASEQYLRYESNHDRATFKGILKGRIKHLRRLNSKDTGADQYEILVKNKRFKICL